jgi:hypothetical protein
MSQTSLFVGLGILANRQIPRRKRFRRNSKNRRNFPQMYASALDSFRQPVCGETCGKSTQLA